MKILYFDCFSGISGDMTLGALLDLGLDQRTFLSELEKLGLNKEYEIQIKKGKKAGITGLDVTVKILHSHEEGHGVEDHHHSHVYNDTHCKEGAADEFHRVRVNGVHWHADHHNDGDNHDDHHRDDHHHDDHHHTDNCHADHHHADHCHDDNCHYDGHSHAHSHAHVHSHDGTSIQRNFGEIRELIENSGLSRNAKDIALKIFEKLALAEGRIHGIPYDQVHFHEVGAVDSIVDIVGTAICVDMLKPDVIMASPVNMGSGFVRCQHGIFPVPAPATLELLKGIPVYSKNARGELVTPTGAAILSALCTEFAEFPSMVVDKIGYGLGKKDFDIPNCLRVCWGEALKK